MIGEILVGITLLVTLWLLILGRKHPILFRMAARNVGRRPRQTTMVIAGLMIGTSIIAAATVAGDSAQQGIRGAVYDALGPVDMTLRHDGFTFFDASVLDELDADNVLQDFDGAAPNLIWSVATQANDLYEPQVETIGFDPQLDQAFGDFETKDGNMDGSDLQVGQAIVTEQLATNLNLQIGDPIAMTFTPPVDPFLPDIHIRNGTLTPGLPSFPVDVPVHAVESFRVEPGSSAIRLALGWLAPLNASSVELRLYSPDGTQYTAGDYLPGSPFVFLNVTQEFLPHGSWHVELRASVPSQVPYQMVAVVLKPTYDLGLIQERLKELEQFPARIEELELFSEPKRHNLTVAAITTGGRGDQFDFDQTIFWRLDEAQQVLNREGQINVIKFSNPGGVKAGVKGTAQAQAVLVPWLEQRQSDTLDPSIQALIVVPVKQNFLELADQAGEALTSLLLFAGSLSIITGLLLIVNIFTMLAEERRGELGMARAVGLQRQDVIRLFLFEGSLYAVMASALGAILGIGLAFGMIAGLNAFIASASDFPPLPFIVNIGGLMVSFASGALLTYATIYVASRKLGKINIVRAIRRIDEPEKQPAPWQMYVGIPLAAIGVSATIAGWWAGQFSMQIFGPLAAIMGASLMALQFVTRKRVYLVSAVILLAYYTFTFFMIKEFDNVQEANIVGPIRGVILTLSVVVIVTWTRFLPKAMGAFLQLFKRVRPYGNVAVSYPQHKRFRSGMTLAMFSIVLLSIGFFSIFGALFETPPEKQTGGFDIEATTTLRVSDLAAFDRGTLAEGTITGLYEVIDFRTADMQLITVSGERTGQFQPPPHHHVYGVQDDFIQAQEFDLLWRLEDYDSDEEAYSALLTEPNVVIVSYPYSTDENGQDLAHEVGEMLQINLGDSPREYTIIGIQEQYHFPGIFLPANEVRSVFPQAGSFYLAHIADGLDPVEVAKEMEANYRDAGMDAKGSRAEVLEELELFRQILSAMKLFLGLGLIIGVLSLGIITSRSVMERRQEIGMMRALGFSRNQVRNTFLLEVTYTIFLGGLIGILCSILVTYGLWYAVVRELNYPYQIPWGEVGVLVAVSYAVALLATLAPIFRAARTPPAEAVRYID